MVALQEIKSRDRTSWLIRFLLAIVGSAERLNVRYAKFGNPGVYENAIFPWAADVESEWREIREELDALLLRKDDLPSFQDIAADVASISKDRGWKTFLLVGYGIESKAKHSIVPEHLADCAKDPGHQNRDVFHF